jgi:ubiquinone/menaquinone biosynthesis C-methylase UbiE
MDHDHHSTDVHERRFQGGPDRLRAPERLARLDVPKVTQLCLENAAMKDVLDIGTGTGVFAEAFAAAGLTVTGLDVNAELLAVARNYVPAAHFEIGPAEQLPFPDDAFDLVFMGLVLHETDSVRAALQEAHRVARRRVVILEWPYREEPHGPPLAHRLKPDTVTGVALEAGYQHVAVQHLEFMDLYQLAV